MAVPGGDPLAVDHHDVLGQQPSGVDECVRALAAVEVSPLDQHGGAGLGGEPLALGQCRLPVAREGFVEEHRQFRQVGRDQVGEGQEFTQFRFGGLLQEPVAAGGHHHGVQDHDGGTGLFQPAADGGNHRGVTQHADLDGVDADVIADGLKLGGQEVRRGYVDGPDAMGVLCRQGGNGGHAVAAVGGNALEVRLDPRPSGRVRSGDGQHPRCSAQGGIRGWSGRCVEAGVGRNDVRQRRHPFAGANRTGSTGVDLSRPCARHPVSVP